MAKNCTSTPTPEINFDLCDFQTELNLNPGPQPILHRPLGHIQANTGVSLEDRRMCGYPTRERLLQNIQFYACPKNANPKCEQSGQYSCAAWGCEKIAPWISSGLGTAGLELYREKVSPNCQAMKCNPLRLRPYNPDSGAWEGEPTWGLRLYVTGPDPGVYVTILKRPPPRLLEKPVTKGPEKGIPSPPTGQYTKGQGTHSPRASGSPQVTFQTTPPALEGQRWIVFLNVVWKVLNKTNPEMASDCWLCLNPRPPYYVGMAQNFTSLTYSNVCITHVKITLKEIQGQGTCLGKEDSCGVFADHCTAYNQIPASFSTFQRFIIAPPDTWWACSIGLTRCLSESWLATEQGEQTPCVLVQILLQVYLIGGGPGWAIVEEKETMNSAVLLRNRRAFPLLVPLVMGLGLTGAATGAAALIKEDRDLQVLSTQVDIDLKYLENAISNLEQQVDSLAEVALQNRRRLDLLFLKDGGLCTALGETVAFMLISQGLSKILY